MINEEILTEKFKYLIMSETQKKFEIMNFYINFDYNSEHEKIESYEIGIKFDYHGVIDPEMDDMFNDIWKMSSFLKEIVEKYGITMDGKLNALGEHRVMGPNIWEINYKADEKHIFDVSFNISY